MVFLNFHNERMYEIVADPMCDIGDCDIRAKQNTSQKTTAEDTFITENINPYFSVLHELTVIWRPLA